MPQSLARVVLHLTFSTKNRTPFLIDESIRVQLHAYQAGILKNLESPALIIGGVADHVHILFSLSRNHAIKDVVRVVKADSSAWVKTQSPELSQLAWQVGYGIFSVSESNVSVVSEYIRNQKQHHRRKTFQEEFRQLCERHGIEIDECFVWD